VIFAPVLLFWLLRSCGINDGMMASAANPDCHHVFLAYDIMLATLLRQLCCFKLTTSLCALNMNFSALQKARDVMLLLATLYNKKQITLHTGKVAIVSCVQGYITLQAGAAVKGLYGSLLEFKEQFVHSNFLNLH
jgi:hypothetical protein